MHWYVLPLFLLTIATAPAQIPGGPLTQNSDQVVLPFRYENHFILVDLIINDRLPLTFIFDTGAENTVITKREVVDLLGLPFDREYRIIGSDMRTELIAYLVRDVKFKLSTNLQLRRQQVLVLAEDYFRFDEYTGRPIHGILGANAFRHFVVKIDYRRRLITLTNPQKFKAPPSDYTEAPIEIIKNKPYLLSNVQLPNGTELRGKFLVDTGASLALLLNLQTHPNLSIPVEARPGNIGQGLGGFLEGYIGEIDTLSIANAIIERVPVSYQELLPEMDTSYLNGRNGIIGNQILERFHVIIDYIRGNFYFKPNRDFEEAFQRDRSGLSVIATGPLLGDFIVQYVWPNSPASEHGILPGDEIKKVNWLPAGLLSLNDLNRILSKKPGKRIKLKIIRGEEKLKKVFYLRELVER